MTGSQLDVAIPNLRFPIFHTDQEEPIIAATSDSGIQARADGEAAVRCPGPSPSAPFAVVCRPLALPLACLVQPPASCAEPRRDTSQRARFFGNQLSHINPNSHTMGDHRRRCGGGKRGRRGELSKLYILPVAPPKDCTLMGSFLSHHQDQSPRTRPIRQ